MKYTQEENKIIMTDTDSFDIEQILECGQCFRFTKIEEKHYIIIAMGKVLHIKQDNLKVIFYECNKDDFEKIWKNYFDLDTNYLHIKEKLSSDNTVKKAMEFAPGIRILNQQPWECLISFIISQNNRIPMIKQVIKNISEYYGEKIGDYFLFPDVNALSAADEQSLMTCKAGFRAKYITDAVKKINSGQIDLNKLYNMPADEARDILMNIKGVGQKVADCTLLFSLGKRNVFPTDVWVKRVMEHFYFNDKDTSIKEIHNKAEELWGEYAGYAQQYLFYYARSMKIGAKK